MAEKGKNSMHITELFFHSVPGTYGGKLNRERRQRSNLEEEILASLFNNSGRQTESSSPVKAVKRSKAYGQVVATPLPDSFLFDKKDIVDFQQDSNADGMHFSLASWKSSLCYH